MKLKLLLPILLISQLTHGQIVSCGPEKKEPIKLTLIKRTSSPARVSIASVRDGLWSDPGTWGGLLPLSTDQVTINHKVTVDISTTVSGITCSGSLMFSPDKSVTLQSSKNIIINGLLQARPSSAQIIHLLRFINIIEDKFIGGGEDPMDSDIGLWCINGKLDLQGSQKTGWINALNGIPIGSGSMTLRGPPDGWNVGDELMLTPTAANDYSGFDIATIKNVSGTVITNTALAYNHPLVNNKWTSEVCNLTRNVRIEGTSTGKSHVFIRSAIPQNIQYVQFRYMGPRKQQSGDAAKEFVLGRYGIHFHHCMEGSRGSIVEGCIVRDCDSHSYVTHGSHGITVHNSVAYNVTEDAFWWDQGPDHASHDTKWVHNVAALVKYVPRAIDPTNTYGDPTLSSRGFLLGHGDGNICDSNVAVGCMGDPRDGGGYKWEAVNNAYLEGVWQFIGNTAHNNSTGFITWQNVQMLHVIRNAVGYNNGYGIFHGAYVNVYKYVDVELYNNPLIIHAGSSNEARLRFENFTIDAGGQDYAVVIEGNSEVGVVPILIRNLKATNYKIAAVFDQSSETKHSADIIQTDGKILMSPQANSAEVLRVQPNSGQVTKITKSGLSSLTNFAPTLWGTGTGLLGEYFNNPDFTSPAFTRIDAYVGFSEWKSKSPHHLLKYTTYSVRWTGKIQPQFSENYTFNTRGKLFIGGKQVTGAIALKAGELYDLRIEYSKSTSLGEGIGLLWSSPSLNNWTGPWEYVPQSQLYPPDSSPPPANKPPTVSAGQDITIQLPTSSATLSGVANDPDGSVVKYEWVKISGGQVTITNPVQAGTTLTGLAEGSYTFRLSATDDKGAIGFDDVNVIVKPATTNQPPTLSVSASVQVTKTGVITLISDAKDPEGGTLTYKWRWVSGPVQAVITNPSSAITTTNTLPAGTYTFELEVSDNSGNKVVKQVSGVI